MDAIFASYDAAKAAMRDIFHNERDFDDFFNLEEVDADMIMEIVSSAYMCDDHDFTDAQALVAADIASECGRNGDVWVGHVPRRYLSNIRVVDLRYNLMKQYGDILGTRPLPENPSRTELADTIDYRNIYTDIDPTDPASGVAGVVSYGLAQYAKFLRGQSDLTSVADMIEEDF